MYCCENYSGKKFAQSHQQVVGETLFGKKQPIQMWEHSDVGLTELLNQFTQ